MRIEVVESEEAFARTAAAAVSEVVRALPAPVLALPSGRTPLGLYAELARRVAMGELRLEHVTVFAVDELYGVPRAHSATNASYMRHHLTSRAVLRALHVLNSEARDVAAECARFARRIAGAGGIDLAVLGIGTNGHIAFNEPGSPFDSRPRLVALAPASREAYAPYFGSLDATPSQGLTLGIADLLAARRVVLLADGASKADAVARALQGPASEEVPASALQRHPALAVVLDRAAASQLQQS